MKVYQNITELIGKTPLVRLSRLEKAKGLQAELIAKLESCNPAGSVKDRVGIRMLQAAEEKGQIAPGATIIEPTSGNTGIGLAMAAVIMGYRVILTMPETMSAERRKLLKAYGAELVLTDGSKGMSGAIEEAERLAKEIPGSFIPGQFDNPTNALAHLETTGPEIWKDTDGKVDIFVAGIGSGGTLTGVGNYLKEKNPKIQIIGVEPAGSPVLSGGKAGAHGLQGIGAGFVPEVLDTTIYDEVLCITEEEAYEAGRFLATQEGILSGISSGAAISAAVKVAAREENRGKMLVVLLPDGGEKYLSTPMFQE